MARVRQCWPNSTAVLIAARSGLTVILDGDLIAPDQAERELLVAEADGAESAYGYFVDDTGLVLTPVDDAYTVTVLATSDGYGVTVEAQALIKDLALFPDRLDPQARVDTALILPAGRSLICWRRELDEAALTARPVLRSVNDLR